MKDSIATIVSRRLRDLYAGVSAVEKERQYRTAMERIRFTVLFMQGAFIVRLDNRRWATNLHD